MKVEVCMVGKAPGEGRYNWFKVFAKRGGEGIAETVKRAVAWGREKASPGHDSIWTEQAEVEP